MAKCRHAFRNSAPRSLLRHCSNSRPLGPDSQGSTLRFDADPIIDGAANALLAAQVSLGRLNGDVPEKKLNLLQFATRSVAEPGAGATKVVRRKPLDPCFAGVLTDHVPNYFLHQSIAPDASVLAYPPKQPAGSYVCGLKPLIEQ